MGVLKDFDCSKVSKDQAIEGKDDFCTIQRGLSYCGHCPNSKCRAFRKLVVLNRGPGHHLVNDDIVSGIVRCPACQSPFEMKFLGLYQCKAVVTVHLREEQKTTFEAKGSEIVKLGCRNEGSAMFENGLLSVEAKLDSGCCIS
jgi:hypothetical protein